MGANLCVKKKCILSDNNVDIGVERKEIKYKIKYWFVRKKVYILACKEKV